jgi:hypothetical protein
MNERETDAIQKISESLEKKVNDSMKDVLEQYDMGVALNVLINVATSMLAKGLIMTEPDNRENVQAVAFRITEMKVEEGQAAVQSLMVIGKAMADGSTCRPWTPKKH